MLDTWARGVGAAWLAGPGVLRGRAAPPLLLPTALWLLLTALWWSRWGKSTVELGREFVGVALGVVAALSTPVRDLRDEVRGVRLVVSRGLADVPLSTAAAAT